MICIGPAPNQGDRELFRNNLQALLNSDVQVFISFCEKGEAADRPFINDLRRLLEEEAARRRREQANVIRSATPIKHPHPAPRVRLFCGRRAALMSSCA